MSHRVIRALVLCLVLAASARADAVDDLQAAIKDATALLAQGRSQPDIRRVLPYARTRFVAAVGLRAVDPQSASELAAPSLLRLRAALDAQRPDDGPGGGRVVAAAAAAAED